MQITLTIDQGENAGQQFECLPEEGAASVAVPNATCPVCHRLIGLVDGKGILRALTGVAGLPGVRRITEVEFGPCAEQPPGEALRIRVPNPTEHSHEITGRAECARCRTSIGSVVVRFHTLFGAEEDERMLGASRRTRVY